MWKLDGWCEEVGGNVQGHTLLTHAEFSGIRLVCIRGSGEAQTGNGVYTQRDGKVDWDAACSSLTERQDQFEELSEELPFRF